MRDLAIEDAVEIRGFDVGARFEIEVLRHSDQAGEAGGDHSFGDWVVSAADERLVGEKKKSTEN